MRQRRTEADRRPRKLGRVAGIGAGLALAAALGFAAVPALAAGTAPKGAVGSWSFDGEAPLQGAGSGNLAIIENADPGDTVKVADSGLASLGKSLTFTDMGAAYDVRIRAAINQQRSFTISLWVKDAPDAAHGNGTRTILLHSAGSQNSILTEWKDGTFSSSIDEAGSNIALGKNPSRTSWQHVTIVKETTDGGSTKNLKLYLNGEPIGSGTWSRTLAAGNIGLVLGSWGVGDGVAQPDGRERFQGQMDELMIYDKALSANEARALYDSYSEVKQEIAQTGAREELEGLLEHAEAMLEDGDGSQAYADLSNAVDAAKKALEGTDPEAVASAKDALQAAIDAIGTTVAIDTHDVLRAIDNTIFGINHRYAFNGYGSFDPSTMKVKPEFQKLYEEAGFGAVRYPGGTISNLFNWKETIDWADGRKRPTDERTPQIHGFYNNRNQGGIAPNFGLKEIGDFAADTGSEIVYVYALARGNAKDAADLVEFLNADKGTNPNGGVAWADVRAELGHDEPYNVRYFELGNEMNQGGPDGTASQQYWTASTGKGALEAYIEGGTASFTKQNAIVRGDWNDTTSLSDGSAGQEFGMRYANVPLDSADTGYGDFKAVDVDSIRVYVNDEEWTKVDSLKDQAADAKVYVLDEKTGYFTFGGDGHGQAPRQGARITVSYSVDRDGFVDIADSMRETMGQINADRAKAGKAAGEMHVYSSFDTEGFIEAMDRKGYNQKYDGLTIHPYSGNPGNDNDPEAYYLEAMRLGDGTVEHVRQKAELMKSKAPHLVPVISEYGIYNSTNQIVRSQAHALYIVRCIMEYAELGSPYIQKHCLVDWYNEGRDALGPTQQAVIQAVPVQGSGSTATGAGEFTFFKTPSASAFEMLNSSFGTNLVATSSPTMPKLKNGVDQLHFAASTDDDGNAYVSIVNLDPDTADQGDRTVVNIKLDGVDLTGRTLEIKTLAGDALNSQNTPEDTDAVSIAESTATATEATHRLELEPHSLTIVKIPAQDEPEPAVKHTVTFVSEGATFATATVDDGQPVAEPGQAPTKDGHLFVGWMLDGTAYVFSEPVTGDLTLEASFRAIEGGQGPTDPGQGEQDGLENQGGTPSSPGQSGKPGDLPQTGDIAGLAALAAAAAPALLYAGKRMGRLR